MDVEEEVEEVEVEVEVGVEVDLPEYSHTGKGSYEPSS